MKPSARKRVERQITKLMRRDGDRCSSCKGTVSAQQPDFWRRHGRWGCCIGRGVLPRQIEGDHPFGSVCRSTLSEHFAWAIGTRIAAVLPI